LFILAGDLGKLEENLKKQMIFQGELLTLILTAVKSKISLKEYIFLLHRGFP
jgi:hypothetical protein